MAKTRKPNLEPSQMLVFAALARSGGVRGAAASLGVPRSTVSRRLAMLEESIGAQLVVRTARRFTLTELGRAFADRCEQLEALLRDSHELVHRASDEPSGTLRIDAAPVLAEEILPEVIAELVRRHPRLAIELRTGVDYVDLRRGAVDVVLRARALDDASDLFAVRLGTSVTGCYVSPAYAKTRGIPSTPDDLGKHDCILVGSGSPAQWIFGGEPKARIVSVSGRVRVDNFRIARSIAVNGGGVLRVARVIADPLVASGELVPVLQRWWWSTPLHAAHAGPNPPSPKVRAFLALVREAASKVMPSGGGKWRTA